MSNVAGSSQNGNGQQGAAPSTQSKGSALAIDLTTESFNTGNQEHENMKNRATLESACHNDDYLEILADIALDEEYLKKRLREKRAAQKPRFDNPKQTQMQHAGTLFHRDCSVSNSDGKTSYSDFHKLGPKVVANSFYWVHGLKPSTYIADPCQIGCANKIRAHVQTTGVKRALPTPLSKDTWKTNGFAVLAKETMTQEEFTGATTATPVDWTEDSYESTVVSTLDKDLYIKLPSANDWVIENSGCVSDMIAISEKKGKLNVYSEFEDKYGGAHNKPAFQTGVINT
jgi:hypothetical protein